MALIRSMLALQSPTPVRGLGAPLQRRPSPSRSLDGTPKSRKMPYETFQYLGSMKRFSKEGVVESDSLLNRSNLDKGAPPVRVQEGTG
jgi:hypothetical protein